MSKAYEDGRRRVALGTGEKQPLPVEKKPLYKMGKKLVAAHESAVEEMRYTDRRRPPFVAAARKVVETTRADLLAALTGEGRP